jgi:tetratricopeptide (TPR) repeat protein
MKLPGHRSLKFVSLITVIFAVPFLMVANPFAQTKLRLPSRTGHVNDFAGVVEESTKQRLESVLANVKQRSGIEFALATVETTGAQDIFDFSRQLAHDWNVGAGNSIKKSLLLVVSTNDKTMFIQFSKSVQRELPEGILGEMSQRMRSLVGSGQFGEGISDGVQYFVSKLSKKIGFSLEEIDKSLPVASVEIPAHVDSTAARSTDEAGPAVTTPVKLSKPRDQIAAPPRTIASRKASTPVDDEAEAEEVELTLTLPVDQRVVKLKEFLDTHPNSKARSRALELLVSAHAALGDRLLKSGDGAGGIEQLMLAIDEAPADTSEKLFSGVIAQIPLNLYLRGERVAAFKAAQNIEGKFGRDPKRLLAIAGFFLGIEQGDEAARIAGLAVSLAPDMAEAHHALGLGLHISLRLDDASSEYKRALQLDPNSKGTRRSLADLSRAAGKAEEALALYREQLAADPTDKAARAGLVLSLLDLGRTEEGNKELAAALQDDPRNLALLTGAAYWFAAHNDTERALELARKAVEIEPRYTWSQISLARALTGQKRPLDAERAIRFARQYGKFPTLEYELANVLSALGLYDEAAEVLRQSFTFRDGQIQARLAGRVPAQAAGFIELLAAERQASIFQFAPADSTNNSKILKALLAFAIATNQQTDNDKVDEATAVAAAQAFASGDDDMRVYRELYAASRLLRKGVGLQTAYELAEAARNGVEAALNIPAVTVAVQADELREIRARAIASGGTPDIAVAPRNVLSNILRGRIEDLSGWALFNQDKTSEAVEHLKRAANVLPEGTPSWRTSLWHLGAALDQAGSRDEALGYYIKSYNSGEPDAARHAVIEQLYRKINGSLQGLDDKIGAAPATASLNLPSPAVAEAVATNTSPEAATPTPTAAETPTPLASPEATVAPAVESSARATPSPETPATARSESTPTPDSAASPSPAAEGSAVAHEAVRNAEIPASPTPTPTPISQADAAPAETPAPAAPSVLATPQPTPSPDSESSQPQEPAVLRATLKITGRVKDGSNNGIANVVVVLISPRGTVLTSTTDAEGNYSFAVSPWQRGYRIIPSSEGFTFEPFDKVLPSLSSDQKDVDFVGAPSRAP